MAWQKTIRRAVDLDGVGVHRRTHVRLGLRPAPTHTGLVFVRTDVGVAVAARAENAQELGGATRIGVKGAEVGAVEHLLAALAGLGVTNAFIDLDGPEVPVGDGSALPFVQMVRRAGVIDQHASLPEIVVQETIHLGVGERWVELRPAAESRIDCRVGCGLDGMGRQRFARSLTPAIFASDIAPARGLSSLREGEAVRRAASARQGVPGVAAPTDAAGGPADDVRFPDESVRHNALDLLGALALLEYPLRAAVTSHRAGHALQVGVVHELLARPETWELVEPDRVAPLVVRPYDCEAEAALA